MPRLTRHLLNKGIAGRARNDGGASGLPTMNPYRAKNLNLKGYGMLSLLRLIVLLSIATLLTACASLASDASQEMYIASDTVPCYGGAARMQCLRTKDAPDKPWQYFYDQIEGFNYERGYEYVLKVKTIKREEPVPADASSVRWYLVEQVSKVKVNHSLNKQ